jgi:membrane protease YdiL (CAAX protease family)
MKRNYLLFSFLVITLVYFFRKIPLEFIFKAESLRPFAHELAKLILSALVIAGCYWVAGKYRILEKGGFVNPVPKNYWMLLLPLLFPGLLLVSGSENSCPSSFLLVTLSVLLTFTMAIMEEVVFRGLIMGYLRKYNPGKSAHFIAFFNAALFALVHFTNLETIHPISVVTQVFFAFFIGLLLSALLFRTNNVLLLGVIHGVLNFMSRQCSQFAADGFMADKVVFTFSDYVVQIALLILLLSPILLIYWMLMKTRPRSS